MSHAVWWKEQSLLSRVGQEGLQVSALWVKWKSWPCYQESTVDPSDPRILHLWIQLILASAKPQIKKKTVWKKFWKVTKCAIEICHNANTNIRSTQAECCVVLHQVLQASNIERLWSVWRGSGVEPSCSILGSGDQFSVSLRKYTDGRSRLCAHTNARNLGVCGFLASYGCSRMMLTDTEGALEPRLLFQLSER